jgi:hypothetical protein
VQNRPHRGVIWPALISGLRVKCQVQPSRPAFAHRRRTCEPASFRISLRIQITLRCGLVLGSTRCSGSYRQADVALVGLTRA